eukprot:GFYU01001575.1.p1 GENE.GFYU01001575.1~~GFYU01001575.1.p1  ORF type:complete len:225 (+),score=30.50 GFYU01001575.1:58-732(+)
MGQSSSKTSIDPAQVCDDATTRATTGRKKSSYRILVAGDSTCGVYELAANMALQESFNYAFAGRDEGQSLPIGQSPLVVRLRNPNDLGDESESATRVIMLEPSNMRGGYKDNYVLRSLDGAIVLYNTSLARNFPSFPEGYLSMIEKGTSGKGGDVVTFLCGDTIHEGEHEYVKEVSEEAARALQRKAGCQRWLELSAKSEPRDTRAVLWDLCDLIDSRTASTPQ